MTASAIKKQIDNYLPLLTLQQQELLLQMAKSLLHLETKEQRISVKQYNKELAIAEKQIAQTHLLLKQILKKSLKNGKS